jgi:siroheme synthase-like protein
METPDGNVLFPIFLKLRSIKTLVVGGGNVGLEKVEALLKNDPEAQITVIAQMIHPHLPELAEKSTGLNLIHRKVKTEDLTGYDILILATDDSNLHYSLKKEAEKINLLTNVADTPHLCDFYLGSTVKKGNLKVGISTNGKSPTFAKRFREFLEEMLPENTDDLINDLNQIRNQLTGDFQEKVAKLNEITSVMMRGQEKKTGD